MPLPSIFASLKSTFSTLESSLPQGSNARRQQFQSHCSLVDAYASNAAAILTRCGTLSQFIVDSIGIKSQDTAHAQNNVMLQMSHTTVEDSASIKAITVVTLIFLPASFIAVSEFPTHVSYLRTC
jgi:hypothetical protein